MHDSEYLCMLSRSQWHSLPVLSRSVVSYLYHYLQCCNMYMQQLHTERSKQGPQAYRKAGEPLSYCRSMAFRLSVQ